MRPQAKRSNPLSSSIICLYIRLYGSPRVFCYFVFVLISSVRFQRCDTSIFTGKYPPPPNIRPPKLCHKLMFYINVFCERREPGGDDRKYSERKWMLRGNTMSHFRRLRWSLTSYTSTSSLLLLRSLYLLASNRRRYEKSADFWSSRSESEGNPINIPAAVMPLQQPLPLPPKMEATAALIQLLPSPFEIWLLSFPSASFFFFFFNFSLK